MHSGSHLFKTAPTPDWNADGTRMGEGVHADVKQVEAPAGAAFICELHVSESQASCTASAVSLSPRV